MKTLIEYPMENGQSVIMEVNVPEAGGTVRAARPGEMAAKAGQTFEDALEAVKPVISAVVAKMQALLDSPGEIGVEFGIKMGAKAGVIFTSADAEANFKITLSWKK